MKNRGQGWCKISGFCSEARHFSEQMSTHCLSLHSSLRSAPPSLSSFLSDPAYHSTEETVGENCVFAGALPYLSSGTYHSSSRHPPQLTEARILSLNTTSSLAHPHPCNKGTHLNYLVPTPLLPNILPSSSLFTPSRPPFRAPERAHRPAACWRAQGKGSSWGEGCGEQPEGDPVEIGGI